MNLVKSNKITTGDVNLAEKVCNPSARSLKGKSMQLKSALVTGNITGISDESLNVNKELKLSIKRLSTNSLNFVITIV